MQRPVQVFEAVDPVCDRFSVRMERLIDLTDNGGVPAFFEPPCSHFGHEFSQEKGKKTRFIVSKPVDDALILDAVRAFLDRFVGIDLAGTHELLALHLSAPGPASVAFSWINSTHPV